MRITQKLCMDLAHCGCRPILGAVQGEGNTRALEIDLFDKGVAWELPDGATAAVAFQKPDGTKGLYSKLPDGSAATTISGNTVTAILAPQVLTCAGTVLASVVFYDVDQDTLATFPFRIMVEANPAAGEQLSNDYHNPNLLSLDARISVLEEDGAAGAAGADGFSPIVTVTQTDDGVVISVTDKNGTTAATATHGKDGADGYTPVKGKDYFDGEDGQDGNPGKDGVSATHSWNGTVLTVTSASGTSSADLKGEPGKDGNPGKDGSAGADGVSPTVDVSKSGKVTTVSITDKNGTKTATINDGTDGSPGTDGKDGNSVTVKSVSESTEDGGSNVVTFSDGKTVTIKNGSKGSTGATGSAGKDGADGKDYVLTEADKAEIVAMVTESLGGNPIFGTVDDNNNIVVSGNLPDGTYSVKYEMADGSTVNIGNLVLDSNVYYTVTNTLTQCTTNNSATKAVQGGSYSATISAKSGYVLSSVKVTMGGTDISSTAVSGGKITISNVTGDIVITAVAEEIVVNYTNLADPTSADWKEGYRLDSAGAPKADTSVANLVATNYIACEAGDIIRIKGVTLGASNQRVAICTSDKTVYSASAPTTIPFSGSTWDIAKEGDVYLYTIKYAGAAFIRFSGVLVGTSNDVIITKNEEIV